jgi:hypothetical protein
MNGGGVGGVRQILICYGRVCSPRDVLRSKWKMASVCLMYIFSQSGHVSLYTFDLLYLCWVGGVGVSNNI